MALTTPDWGDLKDRSPSEFWANLLPYWLQQLIPTPPVGRQGRLCVPRCEHGKICAVSWYLCLVLPEVNRSSPECLPG